MARHFGGAISAIVEPQLPGSKIDFSSCHNYVAQLFSLLQKKGFIDQKASSNTFYAIMYFKTFKLIKLFYGLQYIIRVY